MNGEARKATTAMVTIAAQHEGSRLAAVKPDRSAAEQARRTAAGGASRTNASATTMARNDTALAVNAAA